MGRAIESFTVVSVIKSVARLSLLVARCDHIQTTYDVVTKFQFKLSPEMRVNNNMNLVLIISIESGSAKGFLV